MTDIATVWNVDAGAGDWVMDGADLRDGADLATAVILSLFTDRVAAPDDVIPDGTTDPRGWWGDTDPQRPIGSRLWLLDRSAQTQDVLGRARDYCLEALQWLVDDGVAAAVDAQASFPAREQLGVLVSVTRRDGTRVALRFQWTWQQLTS